MAKKQGKKTVEETLPGTSNEVAAVAGALVLPEGAKVKRHVTLPTLVIKRVGQQETVTILDAMRISQITQKEKEGTKQREPATICTIGDPTTGEMKILLVPSVVKSNLERDYKNDSYVGLSFVMQNKGKRTESQRYNDFAIVEVDVPGASQFDATIAELNKKTKK